jgi:hypothetical protein
MTHGQTTSFDRLMGSLIARARALFDSLDYAGAAMVLEDSLAVAEREMGPEHAGTLRVMDALSTALTMEGRFGEAADVLGRQLEIRRKVLGEGHQETLQTSMRIENLAAIGNAMGKKAPRPPRASGDAAGTGVRFGNVPAPVASAKPATDAEAEPLTLPAAVSVPVASSGPARLPGEAGA